MTVRKIIEIPGRPIAAYAGDTIGVEPGAAVVDNGDESTCADPLSHSWWVDPGTAIDLAEQNGSVTCPFATAQQAADAATDGDSIFILPGASAGAVNTGEKSLSFIGCGAALFGNNLAEIEAVTGLDPASLSFENLAIESVVTDSALTFAGCTVSPGPVLCSGIEATETTFTFGDQVMSTSTSDAIFRDCTFGVSGEVTPEVQPTGHVHFDGVSAKSFQDGGWVIAAGTVFNLPQDLEPNDFYGDGSDGSLSAGFGVVTLTRDMYYANVAFQVGDSIQATGWRVFVSNLLDLRGAPAGAIDFIGQAGVNASGQTAGTAAGPFTSASLGTGGTGNAGGKGGAIGGAGAAGSASDGTVRSYVGGIGGSGGDGGASTGAAGKGGAQTAGPGFAFVPTRAPALFVGTALGVGGTLPRGGGPSAGGGGGGGGADVGGGGGGGAVGAHPGAIYARCVTRDATTNAGAIRCAGHIGGTGGNAGAGGGAGGGGGGGEGATGVTLVRDWLMGDSTSCVALTGGTGGTGGNGTGAQPGGTGGRGGDGGQFVHLDRIRGLCTVTTGTGGSNGSGPSASTGGAGGAGGTCAAVI